MEAWIDGIGLISPQRTIDPSYSYDEVVGPTASGFACIEPEYAALVSPSVTRRLSRVLKMGLGAAKLCLRDAALDAPDAIITGTGLGCMEDTERFLADVLRGGRELCSPAAFIQSTHNSIGSHIAVILKCHGYNSTYAHRVFSFEHALLDALLLLQDRPGDAVLVCGADERTANLSRIRGNLNAAAQGTDSPAPEGEGAACFLLRRARSESSRAHVRGVATELTRHFSPDALVRAASGLLERAGIGAGEIDLALVGCEGDPAGDEAYAVMLDTIALSAPFMRYKRFCGEYCTSSAFALGVAAKILAQQRIPAALQRERGVRSPLRHVLIYNHYRKVDHALMLVSAC